MAEPAAGRPLRVLMISPQYPPLSGGYELAAERLSTVLVRRGQEVTVVTERVDQNWPAREVKEGVEVRRLFTIFRRHLHVATSMASLGHFLFWRGPRYDVWHVHQYREHAVVAVLIGRLRSRPVVLKLTSSGVGGLAQLASSTRLPKLAAWALRNVAACVAVSEETAAEAEAFGIPAERIRRIGNGVDTARFQPASPAERDAARAALGVHTPHLAAWVGRLSEEKNPIAALEAWAIARAGSEGVEWTLALVGDGVLRDEVRTAATRLGLESAVILAGQRDDVDAWFRASDLYLLTSRREGLSNTTMEALASGLPVVTTAVSGMAELVAEPDAGVLVPPGDTDAMAAALRRVVSDADLRAAMGRRGRELIEERYSIASVAAQHESLYSELSGRTGSQAFRSNK